MDRLEPCLLTTGDTCRAAMKKATGGRYTHINQIDIIKRDYDEMLECHGNQKRTIGQLQQQVKHWEQKFYSMSDKFDYVCEKRDKMQIHRDDLKTTVRSLESELTKQKLLTGIKINVRPRLVVRPGFTADHMVDALRNVFASTDFGFKSRCIIAEPVEDKVIDMSILAGSSILCEFTGTSCNQDKIGRLVEVDRNNGIEIYRLNTGMGYCMYSDCRPLINYRHAWSGGAGVIPEGFKLKVHYRSGGYAFFAGDEYCNDERWRHSSARKDIIAFEILSVAEGYKLA